MILKVREQIKTLLSQEGLKLKELAQILSEKTGKKYSANAISHRLSRGTMDYDEVLLIASVLGYTIKFEK